MARLSGTSRLALAVAAVAVLTAVVTGMSAAALPPEPHVAKAEGAKRGSGKGLKIGYISLGEANAYIRRASIGIQREAKIAGAKLILCDSAFDAAKALACAKTFKTLNVDGILNFQLYADAAARICAAGPKVPVIAIDIQQLPCQISFVGANNSYAGLLQGDGAGQFVKKSFGCQYDTVVLLDAPAAGKSVKDRGDGALKGFSDVCGPIHDLKRLDGGATLDVTRKVFADTLTTLPNAKRVVVLPLNGDMTVAALAAAKEQGRLDDVYVSGCCPNPDVGTWRAIKNGLPHWIGSTEYFPDLYGKIAVPNIIRAIKREKVPKLLYVPHVFVDATNISQWHRFTNG